MWRPETDALVTFLLFRWGWVFQLFVAVILMVPLSYFVSCIMVIFWLYCIDMFTIVTLHLCSCHFAFIMCIVVFISLCLHYVCNVARLCIWPMHHHLPITFYSFLDASAISPFSINVQSLSMNHAPCLIPLCQVSAFWELFWLGSKMPQVWILFKLVLFFYL